MAASFLLRGGQGASGNPVLPWLTPLKCFYCPAGFDWSAAHEVLESIMSKTCDIVAVRLIRRVLAVQAACPGGQMTPEHGECLVEVGRQG